MAAAKGKPASGPKKINLAFQGGGSHGAFTWGIADRLLEDDRVEIDGISGTSAGAMNAGALAYGYAIGGRDGARAMLEKFWMAISDAGKNGPIQRHPWDVMTNNFRLDNSPSYMFFDFLSRMFSPYELNPQNLNPLRDVLSSVIDFDVLRHNCPIKLFISATNVRSGKVRIFEHQEMQPDVLLASACLPFMFQAIEIDGEYYWDGGYMGNPAIYPLIYHCESQDVVICQINPLYREDVPRKARDILDRVNEISFNSSLMREMRVVAFVTKLLDEGHLSEESYKRMYVHMIEDDKEMKLMGASSKLCADQAFLLKLKNLGRRAADRWLRAHFDDLGQKSTIDIHDVYM